MGREQRVQWCVPAARRQQRPVCRKLILLVTNVSRRPAGGWNREHDETERNHYQSHEFEGKGVHGNPPQTDDYNCGDPVDGFLIRGTAATAPSQMVHGRLRIWVNGGIRGRAVPYVPQKVCSTR